MPVSTLPRIAATGAIFASSYRISGQAYIACMDDQLRALKSFDGFGTQQPVSIRNDANDVGLVIAAVAE